MIRDDDCLVKRELGEVVRETVEETLNKLLDAEADELCKAGRYERSVERVDTRAGSYERNLETKAGKVRLKVLKLRTIPFESAIIERYKRRECSVEEALIEMYLAGVSVRRVEDITHALWGTRVSAGVVSKLNKQIYEKIELWRNRKLEGQFPYVYLDGIVLKRTWAEEVRNISILVAFGVNEQGFREILGAAKGTKEDKSGWSSFLSSLKQRGLQGVRLFISDKCMGLVESLGEFYPEAAWQRFTVHFYRNVFSNVPKAKVEEMAAMLKAIHAQEDREASLQKARFVIEKMKTTKPTAAARTVEEGISETLTYTEFPRERWVKIRTNNPMERVIPARFPLTGPHRGTSSASSSAASSKRGRFSGFDVLKLDIPMGADERTEWKVCRLEPGPYYVEKMVRQSDDAVVADMRLSVDPSRFAPGTDAYVLAVEHKVAVTPLILDWTGDGKSSFFS